MERLKQMTVHVPMILLGDSAGCMNGEIHVADAVLARKNCSSQELLERIKVMSARKRGPRKGAQRMPQEDGAGRGLVRKRRESGQQPGIGKLPACS